MNEPCKSCPWRKSSTVGGADIPGFSIEMMRGLRNCCGEDDQFRPIMACHYSACGEERACVGYLASEEAYHNIAVKVGAAYGKYDWAAILKACDGIERWESFEDMLKAYEDAQSLRSNAAPDTLGTDGEQA